MIERFRVVHYLNQHFFGIGGEDKASAEPAIMPGAVGPGRPLEQAFSLPLLARISLLLPFCS